MHLGVSTEAEGSPGNEDTNVPRAYQVLQPITVLQSLSLSSGACGLGIWPVEAALPDARMEECSWPEEQSFADPETIDGGLLQKAKKMPIRRMPPKKMLPKLNQDSLAQEQPFEAQAVSNEKADGEEQANIFNTQMPLPPKVLLTHQTSARSLAPRMTENASLSMVNMVDIAESLFNAHRITFTLKLPLGRDSGLGLGLRELPLGGTLTVHTLKRSEAIPVGLAEQHGIALGDILLGIEYEPVGDGLSWLDQKLRLLSESKELVSFQMSRDLSIMPTLPPAQSNQTSSRLLHQAWSLFRSQLINAEDRMHLHALALRLLEFSNSEHSIDEAAGNWETAQADYLTHISPAPYNLEDPRALVLWVKGLRAALSVRVLFAKPFESTVVYVIVVEDVSTGTWWKVTKRFTEFRTLQAELVKLLPSLDEISFPRRRLAMKAVIAHVEVVEQRITQLEIFLRKALWVCACGILDDSKYASALGLLESFLEVPRTLRMPANQAPPTVPKLIELYVFKILESPGSSVGQLRAALATCFDAGAIARSSRITPIKMAMPALAVDEGVDHSDSDSSSESESEGEQSPAYRAPLEEMAARLNQLEAAVMAGHASGLWAEWQRRQREILAARGISDMNIYKENRNKGITETAHLLIHRAVRRQVESFLFLPLRRSIYRCMIKHLGEAADRVTGILENLRDNCPPEMYLLPDAEHLSKCYHWEPALKAFRKLPKLQLPCDQVDALTEAAFHVVQLHRESIQRRCFDDQAKPQLSEVQEFPVEIAATPRALQLCAPLASISVEPTWDFQNISAEEEEDDLIITTCGESRSVLEDFNMPENNDFDSTIDEEPAGLQNDLLASYSTFSMEGLKAHSNVSSPKTPTSRSQITLSFDFAENLAKSLCQQTTELQIECCDSSQHEEINDQRFTSADDFLPLFTYTLVHANPPHLLVMLEHLKQLMDPEESIKEQGYYVATLEASVHLILEIHRQLEKQKKESI